MKVVDFATKAGFEIKEGFYIKEINGYNLMLMEFQQGYVRIMGTLICLERDVTKEELKIIKEQSGSKKIRYADNKSKSILLFSLDELYGPVKEEKLNNTIQKLYAFTSALLNLNIKKPIKLYELQHHM